MTPKDRGLAELDAADVRAGQRWQHWKGGFYTVVAVGLVEKTCDPCVVYAGADGVVWVRALHVWLEEIAEARTRFSRVLDEPPPAARHPMQPTPRQGRFL